MAQIAELIAILINNTHDYFRSHQIKERICLTAGLLHDIGHPPFGHNGEDALDEVYARVRGFEGNAQTLRIVTQLEKKRRNPDETDAIDCRAGLNLTYRTLGAVLKYDTPIETNRKGQHDVKKGYYEADEPIVEDIKQHVCPAALTSGEKFKTIECQIMDIADDIAYSTVPYRGYVQGWFSITF